MSQELFQTLATTSAAELPLALDGRTKKRWTAAELDDALRPLGWVYVRLDPGLRWLLLTTQLPKRPLTHEVELKKHFPILIHPLRQLLDAIWLRLDLPRSEATRQQLRTALALGPGPGDTLARDAIRHLAQVIGASLRGQRGVDPWVPLLRLFSERPAWAQLLEAEFFGAFYRRLAMPALESILPGVLARYIFRAY